MHFRRLFPSLIFCLITFLVLGCFLLLLDEYGLFGKCTQGISAYVSNLMLWSESGDCFHGASQTKLPHHLCLLGIELQFCVICTMVLFMAWKFNFSIFTIVIVLALVSSCFRLKVVPQRSSIHLKQSDCFHSFIVQEG